MFELEESRGVVVSWTKVGFYLVCVFFGACAQAQAQEDPPGVARVSLIEGPASYQLGDSEEWTGVDVNAPLVTGDRFYAGQGGRAEIQLAPGTYLRVGAETQVDLVEVAPDATQVSLTMGRSILRLRDDPRGRHVELDTPGAAIVAKRAGSYRVEVGANGQTRVRVARGEAVVHVGGARFDLYSHSSAVIDGFGEAAVFRPVASPPEDDFDAWERERDARIDAAVSYQHVSSDIYGAEDLDDYGEWEYHRGYGQLWRPTTVSVGWAPYRDGRWVWVEPWGWTWLDYAPWGWAPFHYGRWLYRNSAWYWAPGTVIANPVYAPALVGFYGYGGGVGYGASISVGLGAGYVGWVPLGWGEPCFPWWGGFAGVRAGYAWWGGWGGPRVVNNVIIKQKNIYNINVRDVRHANWRTPGAFTKVERDGFGRGVRRLVPVREAERSGFRSVGGRVGVTPDRSVSRRAVRPTRAALRAEARPPRRPAVTRASAGRAARDARGAAWSRTAAAGGSVSDRGSARRAVGGRAAPGPGARGNEAPRSFTSRGTARSPGPTTRTGLRGSVAPRPPTEVRRRAPSAPREFARRSEPFVGTRPSFRPGSSRAGREADARRTVDGPRRAGLGRAPASRPGGPSGRASIGSRGSSSRSTVSRGGGRSADSVRRGGSGRAAVGASRATASRATVSRRASAGRATLPSASRGTSRGGGIRTSVVGRSRGASPSRSSSFSSSRGGSPRRTSSFSSRSASPQRSRGASGLGTRSFGSSSRSTVRSSTRSAAPAISSPSRSRASFGSRGSIGRGSTRSATPARSRGVTRGSSGRAGLRGR